MNRITQKPYLTPCPKGPCACLVTYFVSPSDSMNMSSSSYFTRIGTKIGLPKDHGRINPKPSRTGCSQCHLQDYLIRSCKRIQRTATKTCLVMVGLEIRHPFSRYRERPIGVNVFGILFIAPFPLRLRLLELGNECTAQARSCDVALPETKKKDVN